jgi:hypothetical protein
VFTLLTLSFVALVGLYSAAKSIGGVLAGGDAGDGDLETNVGDVEKLQGWWEYLWAGTKFDANGFVTALYNVIW